MKRHFPNFLKAYEEYATDNFCPQQFHTWTGLAVLAAALERKVWVNQGLVTHYPNIYTLLVSHPGMGKSTALNRGVELLELMKENDNQEFKIIPNQITEAALLESMNICNSVTIGSTVLQYSSGFFHASEASASALQNLYGDFNATITELYDCPRMFRKRRVSDKYPIEIKNISFNLLAGATFDYLKNLVNEQSVMGGLASRFIYVICKDRIVRESHWNEHVTVDEETKFKLYEDLCTINKMVGKMKPTRGFIEAWEKQMPIFDRELIDIESPRLASIMARKSTNTMKVAMLLSVAKSNDLVLDEKHWFEAMELVEEVSKDNAYVISQAILADKTSQSGATQALAQLLKRNGGKLPRATLKGLALSNGNDVDRLDKTLDYMASAQWVEHTSDGYVKLLVDPDRHL